MNNAAILERLAALPPLLATTIRTVYVEPGTPELLAACIAHRDARQVALAAQMAWAKSKGAISFYQGHSWGIHPTWPSMFIFDVPVNKREWKEAKLRAMPDKGTPYVPTRWPEGRAVQAEIADLPGVPSDFAITNLIGAPGCISYKTPTGGGTATVGGSAGRLYFDGLAYAGDRFFPYFPNPFADLAALATSESEFYAGLEIDESILDWRPPEGWTLRSKAEVELVFAQHNAAADAAKRAAA